MAVRKVLRCPKPGVLLERLVKEKEYQNVWFKGGGEFLMSLGSSRWREQEK